MPPDVIDVTMGQQDLLQSQAFLFNRGQQTVDLATGIDHGSLQRALAPEQGTSLVEKV